MKKEDAHYADVIVHNDGTIAKVHHIGDNGEVFYFCLLFNKGAKKAQEPFAEWYGNIGDYMQASRQDKKRLESWIIQNAKAK
jgi:hypothetical protein